MDAAKDVSASALERRESLESRPPERFPELARPAWLRYGAALLAAAIAAALTARFRSVFQGAPYMPAFLAMFLAGWFGGGGPSLVAAVTSALAINYLSLEPTHSLGIADEGDAVRIVLFLAVCSLVSLLHADHWRTRRQRASLILETQVSRERIESARRNTERILEELTVAFCSLDRDLRFVYVNRQAERILDRSRKDLLGTSAVATDPLPSETVLLALRAAVDRGERSELEYFSPRLGIWIEAHVTPSDDGVSLLFRDTTERKRSEEALQRMAAIVESSEDAIIAKSLDGRITAWNRGAERLFGYSEAEMLGQPISKLMPEERRDDMREILSRIARGERVEHFETVRIAKSGRTVPVSLSVSPVRDSRGVVIGAAKIARDISEQRRNEQAILEAQRQLAIALDAARMGTWSWDIATGSLVWSDNLLAMHGLSAGTFAGTYEAFLACIHPEDRDGVAESVRRAVEERSTYDNEFRVPFADGTTHWIAGHGQVFVDGAGNPTRMIGIGRDITDRKNTEIERERLLRETREAVESRDDFLSVAGHEFRTPLGALGLMVHNLTRKAERRDDGDSVTALARIQRQIERLVRLTEQLLEVGRINARHLSLDKEPVELESLIREVVERLEETARRAATPITVDAPLSVRGLWDRSRLDQVVTNLLTNAVKFGTGKPIEVSLRQNREGALLSVRDHGIGISPEDQARIFERFERAVSDRSYSGMGLGLWITRQIVEAHGGRIDVTSAPGAGATFDVVLPGLLPAESDASLTGSEAGRPL